jgi:hypothetical protein
LPPFVPLVGLVDQNVGNHTGHNEEQQQVIHWIHRIVEELREERERTKNAGTKSLKERLL